MTTPSASQSKTSPLVIRSAIVASLGGLLFGFDTAVISGAEEKLKALYALSSFGEGMIVAIATIGTILGAIVAAVAMAARRSRARKEAAHYGDQVRARVSSVVARGLTAPADGVLSRHRQLQEALGISAPSTPVSESR